MYTFVFSNDLHRKTYNNWNRPTSKQMGSTRGQFDRLALNKALSEYTITGYGLHPVHVALIKYGLGDYFEGHVLEVPTHGDAVWIKLNHDVLGRKTGLKLKGSYKDLDPEEFHKAGELYQSTNDDLEAAVKVNSSMNWTTRSAQDLMRRVQGREMPFSEEARKLTQALHEQMVADHKKNSLRVQVLTEARDHQRNKVLETLKKRSLSSFTK